MEEKTKIYELAKELNTNSKRLMEKLAEINIEVKSHMSILTSEQVQALFKHIGVIKRSEDDSQNRPLPPPPPQKTEVKAAPAAKKTNEPRIIRKTQINLDFEDRSYDKKPAAQQNQKLAGTQHQGRKRRDFPSILEDNSGLRAGFVRDVGPVPKPYRERPVGETTDRTVKKEAKAADIPVKPESAAMPADDKTRIMPEIQKVDTAADAKIKAEAKTAAEAVTAAGKQADKRLEGSSASVPQAEVKPSEKEAVKAESSDRVIEHEETDKKVKTAITEKEAAEEKQKTAEEAVKPKPVSLNTEVPEYGTQGKKPADTDTIEKGLDKPKAEGAESLAKDEAIKTPVSDQAEKAYRSNRPEGSAGRPVSDRSDRDRRPDPGRTGTRPEQSARAQRPDYSDRSGQSPRPYGTDFGSRPQRTDQAGRPPRTDQADRPTRPDSGRPVSGRPDSGRPGIRPQSSAGSFGGRPGTAGGRPYSGGDKDRGTARPGGFQRKPAGISVPDYSGTENEVVRPEKRIRTTKDPVKDETLKDKRPVAKGVQTPDKKAKFNQSNLVLGDKKKVNEILSDEFDFEEYYRTFGSRKKLKPKKEDEIRQKPAKPAEVIIKVPETITVKDLAERLKKTAGEIIKKLMTMGLMVTINEEVDFDTASIIGDEFKIKVEREIVISDEDILFDDDDKKDTEEDLKPRAPVVVVMGHVDHGKTSLLDAIREEHVTETEAGGITQKIGAYKVNINGRDITFLDTPGHEAFTSLRARGAQVTDIAILVVAADDGVKPQTIEAINHAKAAKVQIIVAINKMDLPGANPDRVKQQLTEYGLVAEEWGGDAVFVEISAKKKENIGQLLEMVLLSADLLELKANPDRQAKGTVIEAQLDKNRGPIATLLVQRGTLKTGDSIVTGTTVGRIRGMVNDRGREIESAGPSTPVEILGLPEVPNAGDVFYAITDERVAKHLAERRRNEAKAEQFKSTARVTLEDLFSQIKTGDVKELNIILKADMQGSVEALKQSLEKLATDEVKVKILHSGIGAITESDVVLAEVANAIIIGFNVRPGANVSEMAENAKVDMKLYRIIYNAIEDVEAAMKGMLAPKFKESVLGHAEIRQLFKVTGAGTVAGCYVTDGKISRSSDVRLVRDGVVVHEGKLAALKRFKDDVKEVSQGYECGMSFEKYNDLKEGDVIEAFEMEEVKR